MARRQRRANRSLRGYREPTFGTPLDAAALRAGATPWLIGVAAAVGLFASVALHELGHSWAAMRYGLRVESITLRILGGLATLQEIPREWDRELVIAIAGPITSVLVAGAAAVGVVVTPASAPVVTFVLGWLAVTNVTLAAFNLLPAFPMDGGRVLRALLARTRPYPAATRTAARVGRLFALLFAVVGVLGFSPMLLLLALFVYGGATSESRGHARRPALGTDRHRRRDGARRTGGGRRRGVGPLRPGVRRGARPSPRGRRVGRGSGRRDTRRRAERRPRPSPRPTTRSTRCRS